MNFAKTVQNWPSWNQLLHFLDEDQKLGFDILRGFSVCHRLQELHWRPDASDNVLQYYSRDKFVSHPIPLNVDKSMTMYMDSLVIEGDYVPPFVCRGYSSLEITNYDDAILPFLHPRLSVVAFQDSVQNVPLARVLQELGPELRTLEIECHTIADQKNVFEDLLQFSLKHDLAALEVMPRVCLEFVEFAELKTFATANLIGLKDDRMQIVIELSTFDYFSLEYNDDDIEKELSDILNSHFTPVVNDGINVDLQVRAFGKFYYYQRKTKQEYGRRTSFEGIVHILNSKNYCTEEMVNQSLISGRIFHCDHLELKEPNSISAAQVSFCQSLRLDYWNQEALNFVHTDLVSLQVETCEAVPMADILQNLSHKINFLTFEACSLSRSKNAIEALLDFSDKHKRVSRPRFSVCHHKCNHFSHCGDGSTFRFLEQNLELLASPRLGFVVELYFPHVNWVMDLQGLLQSHFVSVPIRNENGLMLDADYDLFIDTAAGDGAQPLAFKRRRASEVLKPKFSWKKSVSSRVKSICLFLGIEWIPPVETFIFLAVMVFVTFISCWEIERIHPKEIGPLAH